MLGKLKGKTYDKLANVFFNLSTASLIIGGVQPLLIGDFSFLMGFISLLLFGVFLRIGIELSERSSYDG